MAKTKSTGNVYVFSTLACNQKYQNYEINSGIASPTDAVLISGGTGVADKRFDTPLGVATTITEEQYEYLQRNPDFLNHVKNGFLIVQKSEDDAEKVASDMNMADGSRPLVEGDSRMPTDEEMTVLTNAG